MSADTAALLVCALAAVGVAVDSLELIAIRGQLLRWFNWTVLETTYPVLLRRRAMSRLAARLATSTAVVMIAIVRTLAAGLAVIGFTWNPIVGMGCCLVVTLTSLLLRLRLVYGLDGADQMYAIVWGAMTLYFAADSPTVRGVILTFIAGQLVLSYVTAGIAKVAGREWRHGTAVRDVVSTYTYGSSGAHRILGGRRVSLIASWSVILFECASPLLLLIGSRGVLAFCVLAVAFHLSIAFAMGLNNFVWAFAATLPSVAFAAQGL